MLRLAVNGKFLSAAPTGVHRVAAELANALADLAAERPGELDVELWVPRDGVERAAGIRLRRRVLGPFVGIPWEQVSIAPRDPSRLLLNLCNIASPLRANAITLIHDAQVHLTPLSYSAGFRRWYKLVQPLIGRRHRRILAVSDFSRRAIADAGIAPLDRITTVHNGADHLDRVPRDRAILDRLALGDRFVLALATTQAHKNIAVLAEAFADRQLADLKLVLIGGADMAEFARAGIALPANTVVTGRISDGELRALYEHALCLAFPSRTEGFGLPPVEAMRLGCPVVAAPCGALPEVCGGAALYADPDQPQRWIAAIRALADHPETRTALVETAHAHVRRFTWREAALKLVEVAASVSAQPRASRTASELAQLR